jgi:hypothetical protein
MTMAGFDFGVNGACVHEGILLFTLSLNSTSFSPSQSVCFCLCARKPHLPQQWSKRAISQNEGAVGQSVIPHGRFAEMVLR